MATSRKRTRELKKLRGDAAGIWGQQREILGQAGKFWHDAGVEAATIAVNDVAPRVRTAYDNQVKPAVSTGVANASVAASSARERLVNDVAPAVSSAVKGSPLADFASAVSADETVAGLVKSGKKLSKKAKRKALKKAAKTAAKHPKAAFKVAKVARKVKKNQKSGIGKGGVFLIILGVIALGALIYAAAQTLRADDELWVADEDDSTTK